MVANLFLSPSAFWMSALTPAASNACWRYGLSNDSQRAEDCVSGRITPTWAPPPAADDELPPAEPVLEVLLLELPQAARPRAPTAPMATSPTKRMRMLRSFLRPRRGRPDPARGGHRICCEPQHIPGEMLVESSIRTRAGHGFVTNIWRTLCATANRARSGAGELAQDVGQDAAVAVIV